MWKHKIEVGKDKIEREKDREGLRVNLGFVISDAVTKVFDFVGSVFDQSDQCLFLFLSARAASVLLL